MDAHFAVSLQSQNLRDTASRRMPGSNQQWQKGVGVALTVASGRQNLLDQDGYSPAQMAAEMQGRRRQPRASRGQTVHLHPARSVAVEIGEDNKRDRAAQRGIPPPRQDPGRASSSRNRADAALGPDGLRPDPDAQGRWLGNPGSAHRTNHPRPRRPIRSRSQCAEIAAREFQPHSRHNQLFSSRVSWLRGTGTMEASRICPSRAM